MYLRTPKRYTAKGSKRPLLNLRWLWLYVIAIPVIIAATLAWDYRDDLRPAVDKWIGTFKVPQIAPAATLTPTMPPDQLPKLIADSLKAGHISKAIAYMQELGDVSPNQVDLHVLVTELLTLRSYGINTDMLKKAVDAGQAAINADPEAADGWIATALALDFSGNLQLALSYALHANDLEEKNPLVMTVMAEIYSDRTQYDKAGKLIDDAIDLAAKAQPVNRLLLSHAYYVKAQILYGTNADGKLTIAMLEKARDVAVSDPQDLTIPAGYIAQFLAVEYANTGRLDQAIKLIGDAMKRDSDDAMLAYQISRFYLNKGDPNKARTYVEQCRDIDPNLARCLRTLAQIYFNESNYTQSGQTAGKLIEQGSTEPNDYLIAGQSYGFLNQCPIAVDYLHKGIPLIKKDNAALQAQFEGALRSCGDTANIVLSPTPAPNAIATAAATKKAK